MKKRLIGSLIAGIMIFSLVGCGSEDKAKSDEGSKPVASEESNEAESEEADKSNESLSPEEVKEEFARIKPELISYFKENGIKYQENSDIWIDFEQNVGDMRLSGELTGDSGVYAIINLYFDGAKAGKGEIDIDLDKTIVPRVYDIITNSKGMSYKKYYDQINEAVENKYRENQDAFKESSIEIKENVKGYTCQVNMNNVDNSGVLDIVFESK
ncbi:hypothetical protein M4I33_10210 [Clostridium sp. LY3-2]|uniref:hypothetical protein n=1 Tax=Clostridium sp. LY3-2 TaxID=2942482 RepID=UPI00215273A2|nr:hypothetical protein [Clostridium sp. LY3-2]MCR6515240.1 hypothetical protein [Clostridium sp. LY3-2]